MPKEPFTYTMFLIFTGTALFATLALYTRQMMIVAYIIFGIIVGPAGFAIIKNTEMISQISGIGITFLLFLLGMDMSPVKLIKLFKSTLFVTGLSCLIFAAIGFAFGRLWGLDTINSTILATTMMFSSTIIGLKLLPTTVLHHKPTGEVIISILLVQDLIAIAVLLFLQSSHSNATLTHVLTLQILAVPLLIAGAWLLQKVVLTRLLMKFDQIREYIFLLAIGWCLGVAELAHFIGLSHEIGAFIAGITLAANPIAFHITDSLKPIRDFFLIIFFFSLGARVELTALQEIILPALLLAGIALTVKPFVLSKLLRYFGHAKEQAGEVGVRLGQGSEFSLLIAALAANLGAIQLETSYLIQITTLLTFIISPYFTVLRYPTPLALSDKLRRD